MFAVKTALATWVASLKDQIYDRLFPKPEPLDNLDAAIGDESLTFSKMKDSLHKFAKEKFGENSGSPIPVFHTPLVLEKRHPFKELEGCYIDENTRSIVSPLLHPQYGPEPYRPWNRINRWYSFHRNCYVSILRHEKTGKLFLDKEYYSPVRRFSLVQNTTDATIAWSIEAESAAIKKLRRHISDFQFKEYYLTGQFHEKSKRSGYSYIFRKLRPTVVFSRPDDQHTQKLICTLCLHPMGYYQQSFAGCLCPTDDVIAHLLMMRSDEHRFWKKSVQHSIFDAESGI